MKKVFAVALVISSIHLSACGSKLAEHDKDAPQSRVEERTDGSKTTYYAPDELPQIIQLEMVQECRQWVKSQEEAQRAERLAMYGGNLDLQGVASEDKVLIALAKMQGQNNYMLQQIHADTMSMIKNVHGRGEQDQCAPGTNKWDAYIAEVQAKNMSVQVGLKEGFGFAKVVVKWVSGAWAVTEVADKIGDRLSDNAKKTEVGRDGQVDSDESEFKGGSGDQKEDNDIVGASDSTVTLENKKEIKEKEETAPDEPEESAPTESSTKEGA